MRWNVSFRCAWNECEETCSNPDDLPSGWIALVTFRKTSVPGILNFAVDEVNRDAVLCPTHAAALERCLIAI